MAAYVLCWKVGGQSCQPPNSPPNEKASCLPLWGLRLNCFWNCKPRGWERGGKGAADFQDCARACTPRGWHQGRSWRSSERGRGEPAKEPGRSWTGFLRGKAWRQSQRQRAHGALHPCFLSGRKFFLFTQQQKRLWVMASSHMVPVSCTLMALVHF